MVDRMWSGTMRILSSFLSSLPGQPDALRSGNFPNLGNSAENWQSLPSDAWNDGSYRSRKPARYRCRLGCILAIWVAFFSRCQQYRC